MTIYLACLKMKLKTRVCLHFIKTKFLECDIIVSKLVCRSYYLLVTTNRSKFLEYCFCLLYSLSLQKKKKIYCCWTSFKKMSWVQLCLSVCPSPRNGGGERNHKQSSFCCKWREVWALHCWPFNYFAWVLAFQNSLQECQAQLWWRFVCACQCV